MPDEMIQQPSIWQTVALLVQTLGDLAVQLGTLGAHWLLWIVWAAWWLGAVNAKKTRHVLAIGGWAPAILLILVIALVWSRLEPRACNCLGFVTLPNFWWQLGYVSMLGAIASSSAGCKASCTGPRPKFTRSAGPWTCPRSWAWPRPSLIFAPSQPPRHSRSRTMWVRDCDLDSEPLPIPSRIASNEEFIPPPQTPEQKEYEARLQVLAEEAAEGPRAEPPRLPAHRQRHGGGAAGAQPGLRQLLRVRADEVQDQDAFRERWPKDQFIFDVQTHHVDVSRKWYEDTPEGRRVPSSSAAAAAAAPADWRTSLEALNRVHYVKEVFGDSDTVMAIISGVPTRDWNTQPAAARSDGGDARLRQRPGQLAARAVARPAAAQPRQARTRGDGAAGQEAAHRRLEDATPAPSSASKPWFLDDEKVAYPFWERTHKLGIRNVCVHKGLPLGAVQREGLHAERRGTGRPRLPQPQLHHLPLRLSRHRLPRPRHRRARSRSARTTTRRKSPGSASIFRILRRNPKIRNIYFELGSTFQQLSASNPVALPAHARPDDPGRRRRPHPVGDRLDLGRQPAEPDRAAAAPADDRRADGTSSSIRS